MISKLLKNESMLKSWGECHNLFRHNKVSWRLQKIFGQKICSCATHSLDPWDGSRCLKKARTNSFADLTVLGETLISRVLGAIISILRVHPYLDHFLIWRKAFLRPKWGLFLLQRFSFGNINFDSNQFLNVPHAFFSDQVIYKNEVWFPQLLMIPIDMLTLCQTSFS